MAWLLSIEFFIVLMFALIGYIIYRRYTKPKVVEHLRGEDGTRPSPEVLKSSLQEVLQEAESRIQENADIKSQLDKENEEIAGFLPPKKGESKDGVKPTEDKK